MNERQQRYYDEFRDRVEAQGGTVITSGWKNNKTPMLVRCKMGHLAMPRPNDVMSGKAICRACAGKDPVYAQWGFRDRVEAQGGTVITSGWKTSKTPMLVRCKAGHLAMPRPDHVKNGQRICRACAGQDPVYAWNGFRDRVRELGGEVLEPAWLGTLTPHRVRCPEGHKTTVRPNSVHNGQGICRFCAGQVWDVFYIVADDDNGLIKFGITSGNPKDRLTYHRADGFEREVMVRTNFPEARELETRIIRTLDDAGEQPVRGREYFPARVLATVLDVAGHVASAA